MTAVGVHVGVGRRRLSTGGGSGPVLVPVGSTYVMMGDGTMSTGGAGGVRNAGFWIMDGLKGLLQPSTMPLIANSGTTIARDDGSNTAWIIPIAIPAAAAQYADVVMQLSCGANDNVLSSNPATTPWVQDWKDAASLTVSSNPQAKLIVITGTAPSTKTNEATWRAAVWAQQAAHVASLNDPRVVFVDVSSIDPASWSPAGDAQKVHPDERGAKLFAALVLAAIDARIEAKPMADILDMIFAGTYPGVVTQLDPDRALTGTAGTVTNMTGGSVAPTSKLATNLTGSTAIASGVVTTTAGRQKLVITYGGTVTADNKVMVQDKSNLTPTGATPGQIPRYGFRVRAAAGFVNAGMDYSSFGVTGGGANSLGATVTTAPVAEAVDSLWIGWGLPLWSSSFAAKRSIAFRYPAGAMPAGSFEVEEPFFWIPRDRLRGAPAYIGWVPTVAANSKLRVTGTIAGGFRVEPGYWNLPGFTEADFIERRIYKGGSSGGTKGDQGQGTGTLVATLSGSTWTVTAAAAGIVAADQLYPEVDCDNGIGGRVTVRGTTALAAA